MPGKEEEQNFWCDKDIKKTIIEKKNLREKMLQIKSDTHIKDEYKSMNLRVKQQDLTKKKLA